MERLIKDASLMKKEMKELGVTVDADSMSFDNIINAISVMQKHMKIAGTTKNEAEKTISGSLAAAKAAWQNFLTGTGAPEQFAEALGQAADNIFSQLDKIVPKLMTGLSKLTTLIAPKIPGLLNKFLPTIISGTTTLLTSAAENLPELITTILPALVEGATQITTALVTELPRILKSFADALPTVLTTLMENSGDLLKSGEELIKMLGNGLESGSEYIRDNIGNVVGKIFEFLGDETRIDNFFDSAGKIISNLGEALVNASENFGENAVDIILKLGEKLTSEDVLGNLVDTAVTIITNLADDLTSQESLDVMMEKAPTILSNIVGAIADATEGLLEAAGTIIKNLFDYFSDSENRKKFEDGAEQVMISIGQALEKLAYKLQDAGEYIAGVLGDYIVQFFDGENTVSGVLTKIAKKAGKGVLMATSPHIGLLHKGYEWVNNTNNKNALEKAYLADENTTATSPEEYAQEKISGALNKFQKIVVQEDTEADKMRKWAFSNSVEGVPKFGNGAIVTKPTLALIGEDGKEAVVPLEKDSEIGRKFGGGNMTIEKIEVNVNAHGIDDINEVGNIIVQQIDSALRRYQVQQTRGIGGTAW